MNLIKREDVMAKKTKIDDEDFDQDGFDGGEVITVSNGAKTIQVSRKAFHSAYESKGFREAGGDDFEPDESDETPRRQRPAKGKTGKKADESDSTE